MKARSMPGSVLLAVPTVTLIFVIAPAAVAQPVPNSSQGASASTPAPSIPWPAGQPMPPPDQIAGPAPCQYSQGCMGPYVLPPPPPGYTFDVQQATCSTLSGTGIVLTVVPGGQPLAPLFGAGAIACNALRAFGNGGPDAALSQLAGEAVQKACGVWVEAGTSSVTLGALAEQGCGAAWEAISEAASSNSGTTATQPSQQAGPSPLNTTGGPTNDSATSTSQPSQPPGPQLSPVSSSAPSLGTANELGLANALDGGASQLANVAYTASAADVSGQSTAALSASLEDYFSGGDTSDGLENGGADETYVAQSGGSLSSLDALTNAATGLADSPSQSTSSITDADLVSIGASNAATDSPQSTSGISAADLASIGASNLGPAASTSLSADADQLQGQLSAFDQQQAAQAAAAAAAAAEAARQQALRQQQLLAQQQALLAQQQAAQAAATQSQNSGGSSLSGWGSLLLQGLSMFAGRGIVRPAPAPNGPANIGSVTCVNTTGQAPVGPVPPQCR
jgi:hypothetical protein